MPKTDFEQGKAFIVALQKLNSCDMILKMSMTMKTTVPLKFAIFDLYTRIKQTPQPKNDLLLIQTA